MKNEKEVFDVINKLRHDEELKLLKKLENKKELNYDIDEINLFYITDDGKKKVNINDFAKAILNKFCIRTLYVLGKPTIYIYEDGIFLNKGLGILSNFIEQKLNSFATKHIVNEIIAKIQRLTIYDIDEFRKIQPNKICVNNIVLDFSKIKTDKDFSLTQLAPKYNFKTKLNIDYDPKMECPLILKFFNESFYPKDISVIQEWFGYSLYNTYSFKKALLIQGSHDTGKTVFVNLFKHFLGLKNVCSISLQKLTGNNNFSVASLYGKSANVVDDLSSNDLESTGNFKVITGGGLIGAEKKFQDPFSFVNFAKLVFTCNSIPAVKSKDVEDDAYYLRWLLIFMDQQVKKEDIDEMLFDKLKSKEEIQGLLNWALIGLVRLFNKGFSYDKDVKQIKDLMQRNSNPLMDFVKSKVVRKDGNIITKSDFYNFYSDFCKKNNNSTLSKNQLSRTLSQYLSYVRASSNGKDRTWINISVFGLKENDENKLINCNKCKKEMSLKDLKELLVNGETYYFCDKCFSIAKDVISKREVIGK